MKMSIVVISWNRLDFTKQCLESIFNTTKDLDCEIIVVDNGSEDGTIDYLEDLKNQNKIKAILMDRNVGCGVATNIGMSHANGEYIVEVDNDIILIGDWWKETIRLFENSEKIGQIGLLKSNYPFVVNAEGINIGAPNVAGAWVIRREFYEQGLRWCESSWKEVPWQAILFSAWIKSRGYLVGNIFGDYAKDLSDGNHEKYLDYYKQTFEDRNITDYLELLLNNEKITKKNL